VVWFDAPAEAFFPDSEILEVRLSAAGMERLSRYIAGSFARNEHGSAIDLGAGLYGNSRFYLSRERYDLFNTCNVWVARALRDAGCPVSPTLALTVNEIMRRVRPFATQVQAGSGRGSNVPTRMSEKHITGREATCCPFPSPSPSPARGEGTVEELSHTGRGD
jgi:hypothetical protein